MSTDIYYTVCRRNYAAVIKCAQLHCPFRYKIKYKKYLKVLRGHQYNRVNENYDINLYQRWARVFSLVSHPLSFFSQGLPHFLLFRNLKITNWRHFGYYCSSPSDPFLLPYCRGFSNLGKNEGALFSSSHPPASGQTMHSTLSWMSTRMLSTRKIITDSLESAEILSAILQFSEFCAFDQSCFHFSYSPPKK